MSPMFRYFLYVVMLVSGVATSIIAVAVAGIYFWFIPY